jgi:hypothetical protein
MNGAFQRAIAALCLIGNGSEPPQRYRTFREQYDEFLLLDESGRSLMLFAIILDFHRKFSLVYHSSFDVAAQASRDGLSSAEVMADKLLAHQARTPYGEGNWVGIIEALIDIMDNDVRTPEHSDQHQQLIESFVDRAEDPLG